MRKGFKIIINILIWIIITLAIIFTVICLTSKKNGVSNILGYIPINVNYNSMDPTFKKGDFIITNRYYNQNLKKGDIITFITSNKQKSYILTHRIDSVYKDGNIITYKTKGDNNIIKDELLVKSSDIISTYKGFKISNFGNIIDFLQSKIAFFIIVILPLFGYTLYQFYNFANLIINKK